MRIAMIGAGYVGLATGACFAELGHDVRCHDIDQDRIGLLARGETPIYEPGLHAVMENARAHGRLRFLEHVEDCVGSADVIFIAVGTPSAPDGRIDLSQIEAAARLVAGHLKPGAVVTVKSTVVAGTCRRIREIIAEEHKSLDFSVAANPEFLREGSALDDFMHPDRIVIGCDDRRASALLAELYRPLTERGTPLVSTTTVNAELIKYAANAFLALKIGFINEVADLCEQVGGNVTSVANGIGLDRRIGPAFLKPGPGFGGSCFPKDTRAFAATGRKYGARQHLVETLIDRNEARKVWLARRVLTEPALPKHATVCILGLAFKAKTDDIREAAALTIISQLQRAGLRVRVHDPEAMANGKQRIKNVEWADSPYEAARGADAVVVLTEWEDYRHLDLRRLRAEMSGRLVFDYRNLLSPTDVVSQGFKYISLGRSSPKSPSRKASMGIPALSGIDQRVAAPHSD
ncbi:UDP-glucose dehydrogenase family protein [Nitratireductor luteus]|uniref:UDP-glucose dehydrogenase family protein n=1 Tax=Nitratireductor luteus TaxID=2976980 RepID=UPI00223FBE51|nr:UDP-glucose/GDP-mannose dehydrogenase family protein [Nitratireductor luteus]